MSDHPIGHNVFQEGFKMASILRTGAPLVVAVHLMYVADEVFRNVIKPLATAEDPRRTGGWCALWRFDEAAGEALPVIGFAVGSVSQDRMQLYGYFATEKAKRLSGRPNDVSSFQSRDDSGPDKLNHKYGGAIRCEEQVWLSFSGLPEVFDEMQCVLTALKIGTFRDETEVAKIVAASDNGPLARYIATQPHGRLIG